MARTTDRAWLWVAVVGAVVVAGLAAAFGAGAVGLAAVLYCPAIAAGPVGLVAGVLRHRPAARAPWLLLAGAQGVFLAGTVLYIALRYGTPVGNSPRSSTRPCSAPR